MFDYSNPLLSPVSKLDIKDLIQESPSPPPSTTRSSAFSQASSLASPHTQLSHSSSPASCSLSHHSTSTALSNAFGRQSVPSSQHLQLQPPPPLSNTAQAVFQQNPGLNPAAASAKRPPPRGNHAQGAPHKSRGKWTPAEDAKLIVLRGRGMKWEDISVEIPGRSAISCRLHYQNYLEKRANWDEEQRNKLARVYDRLKSELWNPIATELGVPWRACEAMHWALGEADMCRRANVLPFPMASNNHRLPEHADPAASTPGAGRVAQRDRMRGSTRVFEGRDITTITSPGFHSVNGGAVPAAPQPNNGMAPYLGAGGIPSPMSLPGIGSGQGFPGYDDEDDEDDVYDDELLDEDVDVDVEDLDGEELPLANQQQQQRPPSRREDGPRVRKRRLGSGGTRLPGLAELDRSIAADLAAEEGGRLVVKQEESAGRRVK